MYKPGRVYVDKRLKKSRIFSLYVLNTFAQIYLTYYPIQQHIFFMTKSCIFRIHIFFRRGN